MSIIRAPSAQCHPMKWTICILCGMRWFPGCQTLTLTTKLSMFTHRMATISSTMQVMIVHHKQHLETNFISRIYRCTSFASSFFFLLSRLEVAKTCYKYQNLFNHTHLYMYASCILHWFWIEFCMCNQNCSKVEWKLLISFVLFWKVLFYSYYLFLLYPSHTKHIEVIW